MEKAKKRLNELFDEMVEFTRDILRYNTVRAKAEKNAPFGKPTADCLNRVLDAGKEMGFDTYNCDNYAGHIDFGDGKETLGILGHIDVVPADDGEWLAPPFSAQIIDGTLYGRGVIDDKGPTAACLFAMKALRETGFVPARKIRLIIGCAEETGSECIGYYLKKVSPPDIAFSPDGNFPCVNIEKNIYHMDIDCGLLPPEITDIKAGTVRNVVPELCTAKVKGSVDAKLLEGLDVTASTRCGVTTLTAKGISAHGSLPWEGENAACKMFAALARIFPNNVLLCSISKGVAADYYGKGWGVALSDEVSGSLTSSLNMVSVKNGSLNIAVDFRFPVSFTHEDLANLVTKNSPGFKILESSRKSHALHVPRESELVTKLLEAYSRVTGLEAKPIAIGGGTYSKSLPYCVAFGPEVYGERSVLHQVNERVSLERFKQIAQIYLEAIYDLAK